MRLKYQYCLKLPRDDFNVLSSLRTCTLVEYAKNIFSTILLHCFSYARIRYKSHICTEEHSHSYTYTHLPSQPQSETLLIIHFNPILSFFRHASPVQVLPLPPFSYQLLCHSTFHQVSVVRTKSIIFWHYCQKPAKLCSSRVFFLFILRQKKQTKKV